MMVDGNVFHDTQVMHGCSTVTVELVTSLIESATSLGEQGRVPLGLTMLIASAPSAGVGGTDDPHFRTLVSRTPELRVWPVYTIPGLSSITGVDYSSRKKYKLLR